MYAETRMQPARRLLPVAALAALLPWVLAPDGVVAAEPHAEAGAAAAASTPGITRTEAMAGNHAQDAVAAQHSAVSLPDRTVSLVSAPSVATFSDVPGLCPVITDVLFETCRNSPQETFCSP